MESKPAMRCPECESPRLEEVVPSTIFKCSHCNSRFTLDKPSIQEVAPALGFGMIMPLFGTVLFFLFLHVSPSNPPWIYIVTGLVVVVAIYQVVSGTVFARMANHISKESLRKINDDDPFVG